MIFLYAIIPTPAAKTNPIVAGSGTALEFGTYTVGEFSKGFGKAPSYVTVPLIVRSNAYCESPNCIVPLINWFNSDTTAFACSSVASPRLNLNSKVSVLPGVLTTPPAYAMLN